MANDNTQQTLSRQHRDRWGAFQTEKGLTRLSPLLSRDELRRHDLFKDYRDGFLQRLSPDVSLASWRAGSTLFEQGSYLDLAFFVVEGEIGVYLKPGSPLSARSNSPSDPNANPSPKNGKGLRFLSTLEVELPQNGALRLGPGEVVGEIGALNGWPQSVTARTETDCVLLQIRVPALKLMREKSSPFRERLDAIYRERTLFGHLKAAPLFEDCSDEFVSELTRKVKLVSCKPGGVVAEQGTPFNSLYLLRSGILKLSRKAQETHQVIGYLSKGETFGEVEMLSPADDTWTHRYTSVGYSELVEIPSEDFSRILHEHPPIEGELWKRAALRMKETGAGKYDASGSEFLEFSMDQGLVQGSSMLVIDLNRCTRCDDCVRACADTHQGRPRFVREGERYANLMIAKACYHCQDPVCLVGCPTGAIRRANLGDIVEIADDLCIGCSHCAENCPYDAIVMHDTETVWEDDALPKLLRGEERLLASKCDLCQTSSLGPACVRNCPQGCAYRVGSLEEFQRILERRADS